jgi:hypothetical protein
MLAEKISDLQKKEENGRNRAHWEKIKTEVKTRIIVLRG